MIDLLPIVQKSWAWTGMNADRVVVTNLFCNVIVSAFDGSFWRIRPEELSAKQIAANRSEMDTLWNTEAFQVDWRMLRLCDLARSKFGDMPPERCYCLKIPAVLGGGYAVDNLGTISRMELLAFAGDLGLQIKDLPDGEKIRLNVVP